jgi:uncharacterized protein
MKLHLTRPEGNNLISGYGSGWVEINLSRHSSSLIVLPGLLIQDWHVENFESLQPAHFETLAGLEPEIVLLGTGAKLRFPHPSLSRSLVDIGVGLECMDTGGACRTYNILVSEGRKVAAALIV